MPSLQIGLSQCVVISGLGWDELVLGVEPSGRHDRLLLAFLHSGRDDTAAISRDLVAKIRLALYFDETQVAADLLIVLRRVLASCAHATPLQTETPKRRSVTRSRVCAAK